MTSGFSDRTGEVLPVRGRPRHSICERLAKGIRRLLQSSHAKLTVEAYLVWLQPSKMHEVSGSLLLQFLGESDENALGPPDVAQPIRVVVLDHFPNELRAPLAEPGERIVDVLHGEHDA